MRAVQVDKGGKGEELEEGGDAVRGEGVGCEDKVSEVALRGRSRDRALDG